MSASVRVSFFTAIFVLFFLFTQANDKLMGKTKGLAGTAVNSKQEVIQSL